MQAKFAKNGGQNSQYSWSFFKMCIMTGNILNFDHNFFPILPARLSI